MEKKFLLKTLVFVLLFSQLAAAETQAVIVSTEDWRDAFVSAIYANSLQYRNKFITDSGLVQEVIEDLVANGVRKAVFFSKETNPLPTLESGFSLVGVSVEKTVFTDHFHLASIIAERMGGEYAIIVRDDFGFDALSSKFLANTLKAPVFFASGIDFIPENELAALRRLNPRQVIVVGRMKEAALQQLNGFNVKRIVGRDELETSVLVNEFALEQKPADQALVTHGRLLESTLLNNINQPIILVPEQGTYYLVQVADLVQAANIQVMVGIGRGITESGTWLKDKTKKRFLVKLGSVTTSGINEPNVRKDVFYALQGFDLPIPFIQGLVTSFSARVPFSATGFLSFFGNEVSLPAEVTTTFANKGNIEYPIYFVARIRDEQNITVATIQSEKVFAYPEQEVLLSGTTSLPEGNYVVEGTVLGDVQAGIVFETITQPLVVSVVAILLSIVLMVLAVLLLTADAYSLNRLKKDLSELRQATQRLGK